MPKSRKGPRKDTKQHTAASWNSESLFDALFQSPVVGIAFTGIDGGFIRANETFCSLLGYSERELQRMTFSQVTFPEDRPTGSSMIQAAISGGPKSACFEKRYVCKDGHLLWALVSSAFVEQPDPRLSLFITYIQDISKQKRAQEALSASETRFRTLVESAPSAIGIGRDGVNIYVNQKYVQMFRLQDASNAIGHSLAEAWSPEWREIILLQNQHRLAGEPAPTSWNGTGLRSDGTTFPVHVEASVVDLPDGPAALAFLTDITDLKRTEQQLKQSEALLRSFFELPLTGFCAFSPGKPGLRVNAHLRDTLGYTNDELSLIGLPDITHPDDLAKYTQHADRLLVGELDHYSLQLRYIRKDGTARWAELKVGCVRSADGTPEFVCVYFQDITERKLSEDAIRRSEAHFRSYFELPLFGIAITSLEKGFIDVNDRLCEILGYSRDELLHTDWAQLTHPDDLEADVREFTRLLAAEIDTYMIEKRFIRKDGRAIWASVSVGCVRKPDGTVDYLVGNMQDITERKEVEMNVQYLNRVYAVLSAVDAMILRERDQQTIFENACKIAVEEGHFRMAWIGLFDEANSLLKPVAAAGFVEDYLRFINIDLKDPAQSGGPSGQSLLTGKCTVCNDVEQDPHFAFWRDEALKRGYRSSAVAPIEVGGKVIAVMTLYASETNFFREEEMRVIERLASDVGFAIQFNRSEAARRQVEGELRSSEQRFREVVENMKEVFWMRDLPTRSILYISPAFEEVWGRSCASLLESPDTWQNSIHPQDRKRILALLLKQEPGPYDETYRIIKPDGTVRWIHERAVPIKRQDGQGLHVIGTAEDITEHRILEEQFRQSQKMEGIGQLAGGVAHDFNNILAAVMMQAELTGMIDNLPQKVYENLRQIRSYAERGANLTRQLLLFSSRHVMQARDLNLNDSVVNLSKMLHRIIGEDVKLLLKLAPDLLITHADPGMIDQVLMNLVLNARDAMPSGGTLTIETRAYELSAEEAAQETELLPGHYLFLSVTDTGIGIDPNALEHVFEPFFTTKEPGKGTGLGLSIVFGIVKQHNGKISVKSEMGSGTTFQVILPAIHTVHFVEAQTIRRAARHGNETILVVEDELEVRELTRVTLERAGYRVLTAANGPEALQMWHGHAEQIQVLLTDILMSDRVTGYELANTLQRQNENLKVVFISGYSPETAGDRSLLTAGTFVLQKPCPSQLLLETIRTALDS